MKKSKIALTATTLAILSLMITAYHTEPTSSPSSPQNCPVSGVVEVSKTYTPPFETKPLVGEAMPKISTRSRKLLNHQLKKAPHHSQQKKKNRPLPLLPRCKRLQSQLH